MRCHVTDQYLGAAGGVLFFKKKTKNKKVAYSTKGHSVENYSHIRRALDTMRTADSLGFEDLANLTCSLPRAQDNLMIWSVLDSPLVKAGTSRLAKRWTSSFV